MVIEPLGLFGRLSRYIILSVFIGVFFLINIKGSNIINIFVKYFPFLALHVFFIQISMVFNLEFLIDYLFYMLLIIFIFNAYFVIEDKVLDIIFLVFFLAGLYTFYLVFFTNQVDVAANTRDLFSFQLERVTLGIDGISFSVIASFMGTLALLCFGKIENPILKYSSSIAFIILSISLGKITIILSIAFSFLLYLIVRTFKKQSEIIVYGLLIVISLSYFIIPNILMPLFDISIFEADLFFNNRISLWGNFLNNIMTSNIIKILFGNGFFDQEMLTDYMFFHPHNQYLGALYITGVLGFISYILFWGDVLISTLRRCILSDDYNPLIILFFILFIQIGDDYIFFTMEPLYIFLRTWRQLDDII